MGVPEAEVRMVEGTYEETKGRVVSGSGISEEFRVEVGLRQGSALSRLLFIALVEVISSMRDILRKLMYAGDLTVVTDSEADLQEQWRRRSIEGNHIKLFGLVALAFTSGVVSERLRLSLNRRTSPGQANSTYPQVFDMGIQLHKLQ
ncbi:hypothetical protein LSAT2_017485 [Lamellibrachia satsuma]|nr:hypothetical protein LSAT2_017485 [Lamellibrachia satsuma]